MKRILLIFPLVAIAILVIAGGAVNRYYGAFVGDGSGLTNIPTAGVQSNITISAGNDMSITLQGGTNAILASTSVEVVTNWTYGTMYTNQTASAGAASRLLFVAFAQQYDTDNGDQETQLKMSPVAMDSTNIVATHYTAASGGTLGAYDYWTFTANAPTNWVWWVIRTNASTTVVGNGAWYLK